MEKINYPSKIKTALYVLAAIGLSQLVMYLDQARIMAYVYIPIILFNMWCKDAGITWKASRKQCVISMVISLVWGVAVTLIILMVIANG